MIQVGTELVVFAQEGMNQKFIGKFEVKKINHATLQLAPSHKPGNIYLPNPRAPNLQTKVRVVDLKTHQEFHVPPNYIYKVMK